MSSGADFSTPARERLLYQARRYRAEFGRKGLRRKPPMPRRPEAIRRYYYGLIAGIIKAIEAAINEIIIPELPSLLAAANPTRRDGAERLDAEPPKPDEQWAQRIAALTIATRQQVAERVEAVLGDLMGIGQKTVQHATDLLNTMPSTTASASPAVVEPVPASSPAPAQAPDAPAAPSQPPAASFHPSSVSGDWRSSR